MTKISLNDYIKKKKLNKNAEKNLRNLVALGKYPEACEKKGNRWLVDEDRLDEYMGNKRKTAIPNAVREAIVSEKLDPSKLTYDQATTVQARLKTMLLMLDVEERKGKLISKEQVEKEAFECGRKVRDAVMSLPERVSPILAGMTKEFEINNLLKKEIILILEGAL